MNAAEMREQNDISSIIGHLPKRLQEKIVPNWKQHVVDMHTRKSPHSDDFKQPEIMTQSAENVLKSQYENAIGRNEKVISINYFLSNAQGTAAPVLENRGASASVQQECEDENVKLKNTLATVPGILYLRNDDANENRFKNKIQVGNGNKVNVEQAIVKQNFRNEILNSRNGQLVQYDTPAWMNDVENSYATIINDCYNSMIKMMTFHKVLENWTKFCSIRTKLQKVFLELLKHRIKFCCEKRVDTFFWKILFYNVREYLKQELKEYTQHFAMSIIDDGLQFYQNLYEQLNNTYLTQLPNNNNNKSLLPLYSEKNILIAKVIAQRVLISLGDLWRYKVKELQSQDYSEAIKYYQKAQAVLPSNGIPYNQLALISIYTRQKFDAVYYYARSIMSSSAIHSARENLLILFDEVRKKYKENKMGAVQVPSYSHPKKFSSTSKFMRKEVWIYPDGVRRLHRTNYDNYNAEEEKFMKINPNELLRHFTFLYMYMIGILFTGIGMETIQETQKTLLLQLKVLLNNQLMTLSRLKLLKMVVLNIFVVETSLSKDIRRQYAFNFCNQIFGCILHKANQLLTKLNDDSEKHGDKGFLDLNTTLQFIRIYTKWLSLHVGIWEPIKFKEQAICDCWLELQKLFMLIKQGNFHLSSEEDIVLEEDIYLAGFSPLSHRLNKKGQRTSEENIQFKARIISIIHFEQTFLENKKRLQSPEYITFMSDNVKADIVHPVQNTAKDTVINHEDNYEGEEGKKELIHKRSKDKTLLLQEITCDEENNQEVHHLTKLKKELEAQSHAKHLHSKKLEEILNCVNTQIYLEVRPKYLLPDTNCFIDCLEELENIINKYKCYTLIIPLTVVRELYGLSKGVKFDHIKHSRRKERIYHYDDVSSRAKKSLDFIKSSKNNIKCATTKGSIINASLFSLVEEENVCNDDKILATAVALSKNMCSELKSDGKCLMQTELVLITTDRNLRVKALSRNLAVSGLSEFLQWAGSGHCSTNGPLNEINY